MALFSSSPHSDLLGSRAVNQLLEECRERLAARLQTLPPGGGLSLLKELRLKLNEELLKEEQLAAMFAAADRSLAEARSAAELADAYRRFTAVAQDHYLLRLSVISLHTACNGFRDRLLHKALALAGETLHQAGDALPPAPLLLLAAGTAGRQELSLSGCSDYYLIHAGNGAATDYCGRLTSHLLAMLGECGLAVAERHLPVGDHFWYGSLADWQAYVNKARHASQNRPRPVIPALPGLTGPGKQPEIEDDYEQTIEMLADLRPVWGDDQLAATILTEARATLNQESTSEPFHQLARKTATMPVAIGMFGWFRLARSGEHRGEFSLAHLALEPLMATTRLLAIRHGIGQTSTIDRLKALQAAGRIDVELTNRLLTAYHEFASHKIVLELRQNLDEGEFFFNPEELSEEDTDKLKQGLEAVTILQRQVYQAMVEGR
ncbi:MAG TPA: putative nucleotidyltransferase substrate binding domain-containing protein [Geobacteraceae bacterium]